MLGKLIKDALVFTAGAAVGAGVIWLMSDSGEKMRGELRDLAMQAKDKMQEYCNQMKQECQQEKETQDGNENPA